MPGTYEYPSKPLLLSGIEEHGTVQAYAESLGINESSLRRHIKKEGWEKDVKALLRKKLKATPKPGDDVSREETLEQEVRELRTAAKRERKDEVRKQRLEDAVKEALREVPAPRRVNLIKMPRRTSETPHHRQMVLWSDWHGGEIVDPESINNLNEYSWAIMEERVEEMVAGMLSHKANSPALTGLDIALLGDMTSGMAHAELRESNEFPVAVQGVKMGHLLGRTIERLVPHYPNIRVISVVGNHPRLQPKPASKNVNDNFDWVAAVIAQDFLKPHLSVQFDVSTGSAALHTIAGRTMYLWHGDGVKSTMVGIPWGGIMRRVNEIRRAYSGTQIDFWACGHHHQANCMFDLGLFMNGSLIGRNEWGLKNFGGGSNPTQLLLTFSEKHRWLTDARFLTPTAGLPS